MFNINGIIWDIKETSFNHPLLMRQDGTFALAVCDHDTRTIYISEEVPSYKLKKVLCHELTHAAMFSYKVYLSVEQEEIVADLIATYGAEIIKLTDNIFNIIK